MNADALNPGHSSPSDAASPAPSKWHLAGIASGLVFPLFLYWLSKHLSMPAEKRHFIFLYCVPFVLGQLFTSFRSWRRWFYPDRLPVRWAEDSVWLKWSKRLNGFAYGVNILLGTLLLVISFGDENLHYRGRPLWVAFAAVITFRGILRQIREDRQPLPPLSSPRDLSQLLTDSIKPVYSKDWDIPPLLTDKIKPIYSKDWDNSPSADVP